MKLGGQILEKGNVLINISNQMRTMFLNQSQSQNCLKLQKIWIHKFSVCFLLLIKQYHDVSRYLIKFILAHTCGWRLRNHLWWWPSSWQNAGMWAYINIVIKSIAYYELVKLVQWGRMKFNICCIILGPLILI